MRIEIPDFKREEFNAKTLSKVSEKGLKLAVQKEIQRLCGRMVEDAKLGYKEIYHKVVGPIEIGPPIEEFFLSKGFETKVTPLMFCDSYTNMTKVEIKWT